jgi:Domain of unknown function (DUF5605)/Protein of unknown function (DUF4038)/Domain of unknown function (DUF5060)
MGITAGVMGPQTRTRDIMQDGHARAALRSAVPDEALTPNRLEPWLDRPVSVLVATLGLSKQVQAGLWAQLASVPRLLSSHPPAIAPRQDFELDAVPLGSADVQAPATGAVNVPYEIRLSGPSHGNPFVDVELVAEFASASSGTVHVGGFYDGDGVYLIRFLPPAPGAWDLVTSSTARSLDQIKLSFVVEPSAERGSVRVLDGSHFEYSNGEPYVPIGTTAYAWTHQTDWLEEETLATLASSPFTKLRMCIFPKHFVFNSDEPRSFPFMRLDDGFDLTTFNIKFFHHLEKRLKQLNDLGVEADLILFHPYDKWGFMDLGPAVDERYVRYVVRRLAAFPNVWWSLANEYDLVWTKDLGDWEHLAAVIREEDHANHLLSIHNGIYVYDYSADWATHCSIQKGDPEGVTDVVTEWHQAWGKPVIIDEPGYEGDLEYDWGNLTGAELTRRFWEASVRGGYMTHGETYWNDDELIFWSKGGRLVGESVGRIAFLARIIAESPTKRLDSISTGLAGTSGGVRGRYEIHYFGAFQPRVKTITVWDGGRAFIDVIDTWEMTIDTLPGTHEGVVAVPLPAKPYMAIRVRLD